MPRTVAARFDNEAAADRALSLVSGQAALLDSAVLSNGLAARLTLDGLNLAPEERTASEALLDRGGFLLLAQPASDGAADTVLGILAETPGAGEAQILGGGAAPAAQVQAAAPAAPPIAAAPPASTEERIPIVEEELRIGKREVLRGGARVRTFTTEAPVQEEVVLFEEQTSIASRPVNRRLTDEEVVEGGLLQERVVEVTQMREEAVVTKEAFVREELVVTKNVEQRTQQINETLKRTEVETEWLQPEERPAIGSLGGGISQNRP
jgi:stress response protein YsnF